MKTGLRAWGGFAPRRSRSKCTRAEQSYHNPDGARIHFLGHTVDRIEAIGSNAGQTLDGYELEPKLLTQLFEGEQRTKRQLVKFDDLPKDLVDAVIAIEDRRFFQHSGVNYLRLVEAALIDLRAGGQRQGGSTITMQLSRGFFLSPEKRIKRKLIEILIALELEQKLTKQQIFELYANQVDLGQRGSFTISGFGEASRAYFGKDVKNLTLPEAALLAGLIQRPSYLSPYRHPERALERRNLVLESMVETGAITRATGRQGEGDAAQSGADERGVERRPVLCRLGERYGAELARRSTISTSRAIASTPPLIPDCSRRRPRRSAPA